MSFDDWDDWDYIPEADYDLDGRVDSFEMGMFLGEMADEDEAIAAGRAFFGSGTAPYREPEEDFIGLDPELCAILDPDFDGSESPEELADRYQLEPTDGDAGPIRAAAPVRAQPLAQKPSDGSEPLETPEAWLRHASPEGLAACKALKRQYGWAIAKCVLVMLLPCAVIVWILWLLFGSGYICSNDSEVVFHACMLSFAVAGLIFLPIFYVSPTVKAAKASLKRGLEELIRSSGKKQ